MSFCCFLACMDGGGGVAKPKEEEATKQVESASITVTTAVANLDKEMGYSGDFQALAKNVTQYIGDNEKANEAIEELNRANRDGESIFKAMFNIAQKSNLNTTDFLTSCGFKSPQELKQHSIEVDNALGELMRSRLTDEQIKANRLPTGTKYFADSQQAAEFCDVLSLVDAVYAYANGYDIVGRNNKLYYTPDAYYGLNKNQVQHLNVKYPLRDTYSFLSDVVFPMLENYRSISKDERNFYMSSLDLLQNTTLVCEQGYYLKATEFMDYLIYDDYTSLRGSDGPVYSLDNANDGLIDEKLINAGIPLSLDTKEYITNQSFGMGFLTGGDITLTIPNVELIDWSSNSDCSFLTNFTKEQYFNFMAGPEFVIGTDQNMFWKRDANVTEFLGSEYGFSLHDALAVMELVDDIGACTYAGYCDSIFYEFRDKPEEFHDIFGFYNVIYLGERPEINTENLLADMFVTMNTKGMIPNINEIRRETHDSTFNGKYGYFFEIGEDGNYRIIDEGYSETIELPELSTSFKIVEEAGVVYDDRTGEYHQNVEQVYMSSENALKAYLKAKTDRVDVEANVIRDVNELIEASNNGNLILTVKDFLIEDGTHVYYTGDGTKHAMFTTGYDDKRKAFLVNTYGKHFRMTEFPTIVQGLDVDFVWKQ